MSNKKIRRSGKSNSASVIILSIFSIIMVLIIVVITAAAFVTYVFGQLYQSCANESDIIAKIAHQYTLEREKKSDDYAHIVSEFFARVGMKEVNGARSMLEAAAGTELKSVGILLYDDTQHELKNSQFFKNARDEAIYVPTLEMIDGKTVIFHSSPIMVNHIVRGVVYTFDSGMLQKLNYEFAKSGQSGASAVYLLTEDGKEVAYGGTATPNVLNNIDYLHKIETTENYQLYIEYITREFKAIASSVIKFDSNVNLDDAKAIVTDDELELARVWFVRPLNSLGLSVWVKTSMVLEAELIEKLIIIGIMAVLVMILPISIMVITAVFKLRSQRKAESLLHLDAVTGYGNWLYFKKAAQNILKKSRGENYALISFEINKFSLLADYRGAEFANGLLEKISDGVSKSVKKNEVFARYSGAQYAMLLSYKDEPALMLRIRLMLAQLSRVTDEKRLSFRAGVYSITNTKQSIESMHLYALGAKDMLIMSAETKVAMFDNELREKKLREKTYEDKMEDAIKYREFKVYLQPKYAPDKGRLRGAEALVRWISPELGFVSPGEFIPVIERNGFISKLDDYMLDEVSKIQARWLSEGKELVPISVNISRVHFTNANLAEHICAIVDKYSLPHEFIELELTESAFFDDKEMLLKTVRKLREYGFSISMDDFGAGYSSLNSLKDIPLDIIKLDSGFFGDADDKLRGEKVVSGTILLAKQLNMKIVAEGIETKEQVDFLREMGCDLIQGFYFAKPMPVEEFEKL